MTDLRMDTPIGPPIIGHPPLPDDPPIDRRAALILVVAVATALVAFVIAWSAGRAQGYDDGQADAYRDCGQGFEQGIAGTVLNLGAAEGTRTITCRVPEDMLED